MLAGWGRFPVQEARTYRPEKVQDVAPLLSLGTLTPRGLGRSYGDAALDRGNVVDLTRLDRFLAFDDETGVLTCEAGVSLAEVLRVMAPRGWFPPVTPGTKFVTVGGAIACDVHGKNHHAVSSFCRHVESFDLLPAGGSVVRCSRADSPDLFWATAGGMGLTGLILRATLRLRRVQSSYIRAKTVGVRDLDAAVEALERLDSTHEYSVAWVDGLARGKRLGSGIVIGGNHASVEGLPPRFRAAPLAGHGEGGGGIGLAPPVNVVNRVTMRLLNSFYRISNRPGDGLVHNDRYFYPLDGLTRWNRFYGRRGFLQYQCVLPFHTGRRALVEILEAVHASGYPSPLIVLKRFGPQEGILSFPMPGYTIALDFPVYSAAFLEFLGELDELVVRHQGRVYLAKDARLPAHTFRAMYPQWKEWREVKLKYDPEGVFTSSQGRRLGLSA